MTTIIPQTVTTIGHEFIARAGRSRAAAPAHRPWERSDQAT